MTGPTAPIAPIAPIAPAAPATPVGTDEGLPEEWRRWRVVPDRLAHWARIDSGRPFLRCGDEWLGYGEVRDAMRRRGENISSLEVEAALADHPKIAAVAVHAVPSPLGGDDVKACVVCADGASFEASELHRYLAESLPYFAVPRYVEFLDALPLTPTGRVRKHELRARPITDEVWDFERLGLVVAKADRRTDPRSTR